jgi:hypothetical protein
MNLKATPPQKLEAGKNGLTSAFRRFFDNKDERQDPTPLLKFR